MNWYEAYPWRLVRAVEFDRWLDYVDDYNDQGAKVWLKHPVEVWKMGYVAENFKEGTIKIRTESGEVDWNLMNVWLDTLFWQ